MSAGGIFYISALEGSHQSSGLQTRNGVDWVFTYFHEADTLIKTLECAGFEVLDTVRKSFVREGEPDAMDVFIYARAR